MTIAPRNDAFTPEIAAETAALRARVARVIPDVEWPFHVGNNTGYPSPQSGGLSSNLGGEGVIPRGDGHGIYAQVEYNRSQGYATSEHKSTPIFTMMLRP